MTIAQRELAEAVTLLERTAEQAPVNFREHLRCKNAATLLRKHFRIESENQAPENHKPNS